MALTPADGPALTIASRTIAKIAVATMPMRIAPLTLRANSTPVTTSPTTKTRVGQLAIEPLMPSPTGTVVLAASGRRRTKPASTRPMKVMKRPMPTAIAALSSFGTALNTAVRTPVTTSSSTTRPLTRMRPIASGHETFAATETATNELMPSPVASANG